MVDLEGIKETVQEIHQVNKAIDGYYKEIERLTCILLEKMNQVLVCPYQEYTGFGVSEKVE